MQEAWTGRTLKINISNARGDFRTVQVWTGGVLLREDPTTNFVIDWTYEDAVANGAVSPEVTFKVIEVNEAGGAPAASFTVTNTAPTAPSGSISFVADEGAGAWTLHLVYSTSADAGTHHVTAPAGVPADFPGFNWSGPMNGTAGVDIPLPYGSQYATFTLWCVDVWGNSSPTATASYTFPPESGGAG